MSRFKRTKIKSSKKSSVSINEKINLLNQELKKTGMLNVSEMNTSDFYQSVSDVPNAMRNAWDATSHDGLPIAASFADFNIGAPPIGNVAYSPPHPVDGTRRRGSIWYGIASGFGAAVIPHSGITGIMWIFRQALSSGFGRYIQLLLYGPEDNKQWGTYISTAFGTEMLVPWDAANSPFDQSFKDDLAAMDINRFRTPEEFKNETNVQTRTDPVGDSGFLPIDLFKKFVANTFDAAQEGYEYLSEKAREFFFGTGFDTELDTEKDYEKNRKENRPDVQGYDPIQGVADALGVGDAKKVVDQYAGDFLKRLKNDSNTVGSSADNPQDFSNNLSNETKNNLEQWFQEHLKNQEIKKNSNLNDKQKEIFDKTSDTSLQELLDKNKDLASLVGTIDKSRGEGWKDNGDGTTSINKKYDFDGIQDFRIGTFSDTGNPALDAALNTLANIGTITYGTISGLPLHMRNDQGELDIKWAAGAGGETPTQHLSITFDNKTGKIIPNYKPGGGVKESYITEGVKLGHFDPEVLNVDIKDLRKGIMPEYPKKAPPEMIDGYSKESRLAPKVVKGEPTIKITKKDLAKFHKLKKSEIEKFMKEIKQINAYLQKNPGDLIHVQQRYPKSDPRLAQLNWKMDQMSDASSKYLDKNFKVNQTSFKLAQDRVKKNTALTNPDYIQKHYDELRGTIKPEPRINRKSPSRFFKKPKKKSSMEAINDKIKQLDKDLLI